LNEGNDESPGAFRRTVKNRKFKLITYRERYFFGKKEGILSGFLLFVVAIIKPVRSLNAFILKHMG